jgi:hypothetical protein
MEPHQSKSLSSVVSTDDDESGNEASVPELIVEASVPELIVEAKGAELIVEAEGAETLESPHPDYSTPIVRKRAYARLTRLSLERLCAVGRCNPCRSQEPEHERETGENSYKPYLELCCHEIFLTFLITGDKCVKTSASHIYI